MRLPGWLSRFDRDGVLLHGVATLPDGREIPAQLTNLSKEGCRLETSETLRIGARVKVTAEMLDRVSGTVRWSLLGTAGVRFDYGDWT